MIFSVPAVAGGAVVIVFVAGVVALWAGIRRSRLAPRQKAWLLGAILLSSSLKIGLATTGHNFDMDSWRIVTRAIEDGKTPYATTHRYNYGPLWAGAVSGLSYLAQRLGLRGEGFHALIAALLALADAHIGLLVAGAYSYPAAMFFLFSPIAILISGFHSQFDNIAVLLGLLSWLVIRKGEPGRPALAASAALAGLSLVVKHILVLFPAWLLFWRPLGRLRNRFLYAAIAYSVFFGSFIPWLANPASRTGILRNVFGYKSTYGLSLLGLGAELTGTPVAQIDEALRWIPVTTGFTAVWACLMFAVGALVARRDTRELFLAYLAALVAFSPATTDQYTAIPLVACAIFSASWPLWAYLATAITALLISPTNVFGSYYTGHPILPMLGQTYSFNCLAEVVRWRLLAASQFCLAVWILAGWRGRDWPGRTLPLRRRLSLLAVLIAAAGAVAWRGAPREVNVACRIQSQSPPMGNYR